MHVLRWFLLVPLAIIVWYAVFVAGLYIHFYVERNLCPPSDVVSGLCYNNQIQRWLSILRHITVGISAAAVIICAMVVAPSQKKSVTLLTLAAGLIVSAYFAIAGNAWSLFTVAAVSGIVSRYSGPHCQDHFLH